MSSATLTGLSLLIVEDDLLLRKQIAAHLERLGADVTGVATLQEARRMAGELGFDFVLLDVNLPDGSGLDLLRTRALSGALGVVVMTADGGVAGAVEAMRLGALDYLVKPFELDELPLVIERVRRNRQTARVEEHRRKEDVRTEGNFVFGPSLAALEKLVTKILEADTRIQSRLSPVLIQGETGTGKTTIARWIHHHGPRGRQPLIEMNCSAVPETLAESELFGHERGAFTDARGARLGLFEAAHGGTLFLDELPSFSLPLQAKVLKAVEDHRIRRLGSSREIPVDVRVIAATSCDLKELVTQGRFREDLYQRLDLYRVCLPPLRERGDDVLGLADTLLGLACRRHRLPLKTISEAGRRRLRAHAWPGNVRELAHELERALVFEEGEQLELWQLANLVPAGELTGAEGWFNPGFTFPAQGFDLEAAINHLIHRALNQTGHNVSAAARLLGVSRDYVRYRLAQKPGSLPGGR
jgi:two-component system, NtrC family, response regulator AtoC